MSELNKDGTRKIRVTVTQLVQMQLLWLNSVVLGGNKDVLFYSREDTVHI